MKLPRRRFLHLVAGAAAVPAMSRIARAQAYPARPVRLIVPFARGDPADILARLIGQWLSGRLGQSVVIENRPGADGNIGTEVVVRAPADGHTLLMIAPSHVINATLYEKLNFVFLSDIAPVASIVRQPRVMVVNPSVPARTVSEFITYARGNPGKLDMASAGIGTGTHLTGELFKVMAGVDMVHVPYRGVVPALSDLVDGQVQVYFDAMPPLIEYIRAGKLRALAVTGATRSEALPNLPTVGESVPGYEASGLYGLGAPRNTSAEIVDRLNREINAGLADPKVRARLADLGGGAFASSPAEFAGLLAGEVNKWGRIVKFSGAKPP